MTDNVDDFLAHYGVKGMKWGVTRSQYKSLSKSDKKQYRKKTFRERSKTLRNAQAENAKLTIEAAVKGGSNVLIRSRGSMDSLPTVMTGKEFSAHVARGGAFDVKVTSVVGYTNTKAGREVQKLVESRMNDIWNPTAERYVRKEA